MNVAFATYASAFARHGGPMAQISQTREELRRLGVEVSTVESTVERDALRRHDLVHLFAAGFGTYDIARYLHREKIPFVVSPIFFTRRSGRTVRTVIAAESAVRWIARGLWSDYGFVRDICRWAALVLPNTTEERRLIIEGLKIRESKVTIVPNGVEERFGSADPAEFVRQHGVDDFILNVGHIGGERKNTLSLIRALEGIDHPSVIIGRVIPSREAELCLKEAGRNPKLKILPGLDHATSLLASAYAACRVFALPALYETPGIAALEAALAGARIVITPHGGTKDYFGGDAIYVNPCSVEAIRVGICTALAQPKSDRLRDRMRKNFLWSHVARQTLDAYHRALSQ